MSITTTVIEARAGLLDSVREYLSGISEIDIFGEKASVNKILITIDADDARTEEIHNDLMGHENILDVLNHSVFFEDALDK